MPTFPKSYSTFTFVPFPINKSRSKIGGATGSVKYVSSHFRRFFVYKDLRCLASDCQSGSVLEPETEKPLGRLYPPKIWPRELKADIYSIHGWEYKQYSSEIRHMPKIVEFLGYVPWNISAKTLGEKITAYCKLHGITKQELAQQLNIHPSTISRWMAGKRPKKELSQKLTAFLISENPSVK